MYVTKQIFTEYSRNMQPFVGTKGLSMYIRTAKILIHNEIPQLLSGVCNSLRSDILSCELS